MISIILILESHLLTVCNNEKPDLTGKLDVSLELRDKRILLMWAIIKIYQVSEGRLVAHFLTSDTTFCLALILQNLVPLGFLKYEKLQTPCLLVYKAFSGKFYSSLDTSYLILCEGHFRAESPTLVQVYRQIRLTCHYFTIAAST